MGSGGRGGEIKVGNDKLPQAVCNSSYVPHSLYICMHMASAQNGVTWQPTKSHQCVWY